MMPTDPLPMRDAEVHALLLAAGAGRRFGGDKLVHPFRGRPLIAHAAAALAESLARGVLAGGIAVVPPRVTALAWSLDIAGLELVENPAPDEGLSRSLRLGLDALARRMPAAVLVVLADQPLLRPDVIGRLVDRWRETGATVRPRYAADPATPGHPVLLGRSVWTHYGQLRADAGFDRLLAQVPGGVQLVDVAGANPDIDRLQDLRLLEEQP